MVNTDEKINDKSGVLKNCLIEATSYKKNGCHCLEQMSEGRMGYSAYFKGDGGKKM